MGRRGGSEVDIVVVAPAMSSAFVGRILDNHNVQGRKKLGAVFSSSKIKP